ncbi:MAG: helix-turn-helix transcriptional regulator [Ruminococcaceae bacterium]|nr:helix-turn-helix transcriptional regulator [Oscillospiraceae bacterium]
MFENIENLKILSAIHKVSNPYGKAKCRKTNGFLIRVRGVVQYDFPDKSVIVREGEMMFLPKGSQYEYHIISEGDAVCTAINVEGEFGEAQPTCYSIGEFYDAEYIKYHFADLWKFGNQAQKYQCYSLLYNLISYLSNIEAQQYQDKKKFEVIQPAVDYLRRHIYDCDLKIDELHKLCGVSDTYFRKIFISKFGTSPKNYIIGKRVSYAKSIIDSGEFSTVKELALMAGYKDPLYFGKVFKQHYGASPVHMNQ